MYGWLVFLVGCWLIHHTVGDDPLIPVETKFLLTTNPEYTSKTSSITELGVNIHANDRYFERPEVLKSYREQEVIQTPDFVNTTEVPTVGGRFRARNLEDVRSLLSKHPIPTSYNAFT